MALTKTKVAAGVVGLLLVGMAVVVKLVFFPSVSDKFFQINQARLRQAPPGLVIVRPTHFANSSKSSSPQQDFGVVNVKGAIWMVGRNMTFQKLIATAYSYDLGRIALPMDAPKGNFDFLVTVPKEPQAHLQSAIRRKLGYTAQPETRDTPVLALKVENPDLPGLKASTPDEKENADVRNGRLYFTHQRLTVVTDGLEQMMKSPVVDKTGLTNFYDFSLIWDAQTAQQIQSGTLDQATGQKILADWGLALEPDTASLEMLVVKKSK
jgi:uncharacterized protein (TIGR03435 family)